MVKLHSVMKNSFPHFHNTDIAAREIETVKKRAAYQVIAEVKSSPVGVDWLMIMAAKQAIQQPGYFQKPITKAAVLDRSRK